MTIARAEGVFTENGQISAPVQLIGPFNITLSGLHDGMVVLERSFDAGATWHAVSINGAPKPTLFEWSVSLSAEESERGVLYRLRCITCARHPVNYRLSQ